MPPITNLHLSLLELGHSMTADANAALVTRLATSLSALLSYPRAHSARLYRPTLACDASSLVLKFLPADDAYSIHHLRRDLFERVRTSGVSIAPRYVVPSAHLSVARFVDNGDFEEEGRTSVAKMQGWWALVEAINKNLAERFDSRSGGRDEDGAWTVDNAQCRYGAQWYGGGQSWSNSDQPAS